MSAGVIEGGNNAGWLKYADSCWGAAKLCRDNLYELHAGELFLLPLFFVKLFFLYFWRVVIYNDSFGEFFFFPCLVVIFKGPLNSLTDGCVCVFFFSCFDGDYNMEGSLKTAGIRSCFLRWLWRYWWNRVICVLMQCFDIWMDLTSSRSYILVLFLSLFIP